MPPCLGWHSLEDDMNKELTVAKNEVQQHAEHDQVLSMIERIVMSPDVPMDRLEKMLEMQERILKRQEQAAFNTALVSAMAEMPMFPLNGQGHNNMAYAKLKDIIGATRPTLSKFGLALTFDVKTEGGTVTTTAVLRHSMGYVDRVQINLPNDTSGSKNAVQAAGSAQTYGQRYAAQAILGLSLGDDVDDDGAALSKGLITPDQYIQLRDKAEDAGTAEKTIVAAYKAASLTEFPAKHFDAAMKRLQLTIDKKGATDGPAK